MIYQKENDKIFDNGPTMGKAVFMISVWDKKYDSYTEHYISFSKEDTVGLLYLRNIEKFEAVILPEELFRIEYFAGKNILSTNRTKDKLWFHVMDRKKKASALCLITSLSVKTQILPSKCGDSVDASKWKEYLEATDDIDFLSPAVQEISKKIVSGFSKNDTKNFYWKASNAFSWVRDNISYSLLPREIIEHIKKTIISLPLYRRDPYTILQTSFPKLSSDKLKEISSHIEIPSDLADPYEQARYITRNFGERWRLLFYTWEGRKARSASKTITDKVGKCDCFSHAFVALCRSMGIPAFTVIGYLREEGRHAWAAVYIPPYGWIEADPTNDRFLRQFDNENYFYEFLRDNFKGENDILPIKSPISERSLNACKKFYEYSEDHPFPSRIMFELER